MPEAIVANRPVNCQWLTRDWSQYTLKTFDARGICTNVEVLTKSQAETYYDSHPGGRQIGHEHVRFSGFGGQFTYQIDLEQVVK